MTNQSKLLDPLKISCHEYLHPWTKSCTSATAGMLLAAIEPSLRTYVTFYVLALAMRMRIPTLKDLQNTLQGILRSTAFLTTNAYGFVMFTCLLRALFGRFYFSTVAFVPTFLASLMALSLESRSRRTPLALYVANVGGETLWHMLEARGLVRSLPNGQVLIFGLSVSVLLYLYRLGLHKTIAKDPIFNVLCKLVGKEEEGSLQLETQRTTTKQPLCFSTISGLVAALRHFKEAKHVTCQHTESCFIYSISGGLQSFAAGIGLQLGLQLLTNMKNILNLRLNWRKQIFHKSNLKLGIFLGSFSFLYKSISCALRHAFDYDDARFAIPAGLIGSIGFIKYPNTTIACYVIWKALQLSYSCAMDAGVLPEIPHFVMVLYAFFTATLFHAAILESNSLRSSYFKFLESISGARLSRFNVQNFDVFGLNSFKQHKYAYKRLKIDISKAMPNISLIV